VSLRRRLVVGMLVLLVVGIVTADVVTSSSLRSFLLGRLDAQIDVTENQAYAYLSLVYQRDLRAGDRTPVTNPAAWLGELAIPPPNRSTFTPLARGQAPRLNRDILAARLSPDAYVLVTSTGGAVVFRDPSGSPSNPDPAPVVPRSLPVQHLPAARLFGTRHGPYLPEAPSLDVSAVGGPGIRYRVQAVAVPGGTLVTAISLDPTNRTLASLTHIEVLVSIAVIVALLALVLWTVRLGLRPLEDMTNTADAIAGGDLARRVGRADDRGEVGRLGRALDAMLSQIEAAFAERTASESRLRRFVADASHELRTPLTSIRGYAELLRKGAFRDEDARRRAAERIENESARMSLLVDDLLLLARLDQGRPLALETVDVRQVVAEAVEAVAVNEPDRPVTLVAARPVLVHGDTARLRQIADNLLRNAVVHTPAGTPVRVEVSRQGDRGELAVLAVADEGPGLDAVEAAHVFDRFYRASAARTGEGTGLGLAIVEALAVAHGGRARVESSPGKGATFIVELPASGDVDGAEAEAGASQGGVPPRRATAVTADEDLARTVRR
jgi:two-component system OmpR family sensor kinase